MAYDTKLAKAIGVDGIKIFDTTCVICRRNGLETDGQYHCKYCGVMCEKCSAKHQKLPKTGHWAMKLKTVVQPDPVPTFQFSDKCEVHPSHKICRYCIDCGQLLCGVCTEESHTECQTETVERMSVNILREKDMRDARLELEDLRVRNNKTRKNKMKEMKQLSKQADGFVDKVLNVRQKINALFDSMLEVIMKDKNDFCNAEAEMIEKRILQSSVITPVIDSARDMLNDSYKSGDKLNLWIAIKKLERIVSFYDKIVSEIEADKCDVKFEFVPCESLASLLKEPENIGKMKVTSARLQVEKVNVAHRPMQKTATSKKTGIAQHPSPWSYGRPESSMKPFQKLPAIMPLQRQKSKQVQERPLSKASNRSKSMDSIDLRPKHLTSRDRTKTSIYLTPATSRSEYSGLKVRRKNLSKIAELEDDRIKRMSGAPFGELQDIKLSNVGKKEISIPEDDNKHCITGSTFLRNGRLVLVDYNNKSLKLYASDFQLITCTFTDERPWDVAECHKTVIAVSYPFINAVEIIETGTEFIVTRKVNTDRKCHGVAYHSRDKMLYVACGEGLEARLQAYTLDGFIRRVIIPEEGVLHEPCFLTMTQDNRRIYLSDLDNGIIGFDVESGAMMCQYKDPKVKRYWDLTTDMHGHVFVVTADPDCLYVLMGEHNGQLLTTLEGDTKACSICFDPITNNILVSRWKSDEIEVFRAVYARS